jgi:hypothetical protein
MTAGHALVIDPVESTDLWKLGSQLENPIVTKQDSDSPLMRHVRLDNVILPEARQLTPIDGAKPLVTALSGDPLYFSIEQPERKVLVLSVNLNQGDLTFRTAFPIMATNALAWFAGEKAELRESLATGAVTEVALPNLATDAKPLICQTPSGTTIALPLGAAKTPIGPLDQCGVWRVVEPSKRKGETAGQGGIKPSGAATEPLVEIACNLANREESDLRVPEGLLKSRTPTVMAAGWITRPIWFYLVAAAWLLAAVEWFLYQRRWIT